MHHEVKRLAQEGVDNGEAFLAANGYYCAAKLMLELRLPYCAERVLKHATGIMHSDSRPKSETPLDQGSKDSASRVFLIIRHLRIKNNWLRFTTAFF